MKIAIPSKSFLLFFMIFQILSAAALAEGPDSNVNAGLNYQQEQNKKVEPSDDEDPFEPTPGLCPLWHDRRKINQGNRIERKEIIAGLFAGDEINTVVVKRRRLKKPAPAGGGIRLKSITLDKESGSWSARLFIPAGYSCGEGVHTIYRDDSITDNTSVLEITKDFVLLLHDGQLAYLKPKGRPPVKWRLVWDTGIDLEYETGKVSGAAKGKKPKKKKRKKRKPTKKLKNKLKKARRR